MNTSTLSQPRITPTVAAANVFEAENVSQQYLESERDTAIENFLVRQRQLQDAYGESERDEAAENMSQARTRLENAREALAGRPMVATAPQAEAVVPKAAARQEPTFEALSAKEPVNFDSIREVVKLSRRLAMEDYRRHVSSAVNAPLGAESALAIERLKVAEKSARLADGAYQSLLSAESDFRGTTVSLIGGDAAAAETFAASSGAHLGQVADKLDRFGSRVPQSKLFAATLNAVAKADEVAGRVEVAVAMKVESFTTGLKAFAKRVSEFGASVARMPSVVADTAKTAGITTAKATVATGAHYMAAFRGLVDRASAKVGATKDSVNQSAWSMIERADKAAARVERGIASSIDAVSTHGQATMGLAGGLLSAVGRAVKKEYVAQVEQVETVKAVRRATPR